MFICLGEYVSQSFFGSLSQKQADVRTGHLWTTQPCRYRIVRAWARLKQVCDCVWHL